MVGKQKRRWKPAWIRKELLVGLFQLERYPVKGGYKLLQSCPTFLLLQTRLLCPWDFPGKTPGVGCHFLIQGIFPTQGWNPCLLQMGGFYTTEQPGKSGLGSNFETSVQIRGRGLTYSRWEEIAPHFCQVEKRNGGSEVQDMNLDPKWQNFYLPG